MNDILEEKPIPKKAAKSSVREKNSGRQNKTKKCKVIQYDRVAKALDVLFDIYGIRFSNVHEYPGEYVEVEYQGEIGRSDFKYKLKIQESENV